MNKINETKRMKKINDELTQYTKIIDEINLIENSIADTNKQLNELKSFISKKLYLLDHINLKLNLMESQIMSNDTEITKIKKELDL